MCCGVGGGTWERIAAPPPAAVTENDGTHDPCTCVQNRMCFDRRTKNGRTRLRGYFVLVPYTCSGRQSRPVRTTRTSFLAPRPSLPPTNVLPSVWPNGRGKRIVIVSRPPSGIPFWSPVDVLTNVSRGPRRKRPSVPETWSAWPGRTRNRLKSPWPATVREAYAVRTDSETICARQWFREKNLVEKNGSITGGNMARGNRNRSPTFKKNSLPFKKGESKYNRFDLSLQL